MRPDLLCPACKRAVRMNLGDSEAVCSCGETVMRQEEVAMAAVPQNSGSLAPPPSKPKASESLSGSSSESIEVNPFAQAVGAVEDVRSDVKTSVEKPKQGLPTPPPKPTPPAKKPDPQWLFNYSRVELEIRIEPKGWTQPVVRI